MEFSFTKRLKKESRDKENKKTDNGTHVCVVGGSGAGKYNYFIGPSLLQKNSSYVVTDPYGVLYQQYGKFLEYYGYKVKCFNLSAMGKGNRYNPFRYIHNDEDVDILVSTLLANTVPPETPATGPAPDPFWEKAEVSLLAAVIAYIRHYYIPPQQNFTAVMELLRAAYNENDPAGKTCLDSIFDKARSADPGSYAVRQYDNFLISAGKTCQKLVFSCVARLQAFDLQDIAELTKTDNIDLEAMSDEKTALFIIISARDAVFNFLAAMMYVQLFRVTRNYCKTTAPFTQVVLDGEGQVVKAFRADNEIESKEKAEKAQKWLESAKKADIVHQEDMGWYELVMDNGEIAAFRGSKKEAQKALGLIGCGCVVANSERSNEGWCLPVSVQMLFNGFTDIGKIPGFENAIATNSYKSGLSVTIFLQSISPLKKMYRDDWADIIGNCDTIIYHGSNIDLETAEWIYGSNIDLETAEWIFRLLGKKAGILTSCSRPYAWFYSRLCTAPENEYIVIARGMPAHKEQKTPINKHKEWSSVKMLGEYHFSREKMRYLYPAAWGATG